MKRLRQYTVGIVAGAVSSCASARGRRAGKNVTAGLGLLIAAAIIPGVGRDWHSAAQPATSCAVVPHGTLWRSLNPDLHPTPGSPAEFRLADERSQTLWLNTRPDLHPTPGSPAAFRLAEQRNLVASVKACLYS